MPNARLDQGEEASNQAKSTLGEELPVGGEHSATMAGEVGGTVPSSASMPGVVLTPPTPQTSQEAVAYEKGPLVIQVGSGVTGMGADMMPEDNGVKDVSDTDEADQLAEAEADPPLANKTAEPSVDADAQAPGSEPGPQVFERVQLLAPPSNPDHSSPVPRSRSRSRARRSPIPVDQLRRSPRLRSASPATRSSPLTPTPSSPAPMPVSPSRPSAKRGLAEDTDDDITPKRPRNA